MKKMIAVGIAACSLMCAGSQKVDELWAFVRAHDGIDASTPEGDKIRDEIEARQNALSPEEKKEFEQKTMAAMMEQMQKAMKCLAEVPVDTPAAKVDFFADDTNSVDSVFGVPFGTKVGKEIVTPGSDAGPLALLANETKLKIPKPVKWFTTVSGQPDMRNRRIYSMTFKAEMPDTMSEDELQRGIRQLEQLMTAKFGKECLEEDRRKGDFTVGISDSKKRNEELDAKYPNRKDMHAKLGFKPPRTLTLYMENRRIAKLDPEISEPKVGDGFADNLKIPEGLELAEPKKEGFVPSGKADFVLINGMQGGIYLYRATVTSDEDGEVYLRAYEVTKGTRLSADRMKQRTTEKITGKGKHTIGVGRKFTIYEGDWGKFYAARLEIWFVPANGGKPRKLKEKLFKVQGWMF